MSFAWRVYRRLAQAFPHEFKVAYGTEVMQLGEDVVEDIAKRQGVAGLIRLIADIAIRVPIEYFHEVRGDLRYAWRGLIKSPGFALVGILSMGLGIGLTTHVYGTKWALLFQPLPGAENAARLVMLQKSADADIARISYYYIEQFRQEKKLFSGVAAFETGIPFNVAFEENLNAKPVRVYGQLVSPDYFSVLGLQAKQGRVFNPADDRFGEAPIVVISDRFWRNRLNGSAEAIGKMLRINGQMATIVGITPKDFKGALGLNPAELFVPITAPAAMVPELAGDVLHEDNAKDFSALFCLAPSVTIDSAEASLDVIMRRLDSQDVAAPARIDAGRRIALLSAGTNIPLPRALKPALMGFFLALMGLVIALACMNLANMLIARCANRRKEFAIRLSIGAGRGRLVRQMMCEGILLALLGGIAGFGVAYVLGALNQHFVSFSAIPLLADFRLDWRTGFFVFGAAMVCGIGFTLGPALQGARHDLTPALKEGAALQLPGYRRFGFRNLLMVVQVGASLTLLMVTGFLVLGVSKKMDVDAKIDARTMTMFSLDPVRDGYPAEKTQALFEQISQRLRAIPSVRSIAFAMDPPYSTDLEPTQIAAEGDSRGTRVLGSVEEKTVGAGFFAALNEPVVAGREFATADERMASDAKVLPMVLSESAAHGLFGNENAIGKRVRDDNRAYEVVGIVGDMKGLDGLKQTEVYLPLTSREFKRPPAGGITVLVRSDLGTDALGRIRDEIAFLNPNLNLWNVQTLQVFLDRSRAAARFSVQTYGGIGVFGLILAAIGLAGVTAYAVAQRRKEIGIRTALGATKRQVLALVLREGAALIAAGTILGFLGAVGLAKVVSTLMNTFADAMAIGTTSPLLLVGAPALLAVVALLACYVPARGAAKVDPLRALREE